MASLTRSNENNIWKARWLAELLTDGPVAEWPVPLQQDTHEFECVVKACK